MRNFVSTVISAQAGTLLSRYKTSMGALMGHTLMHHSADLVHEKFYAGWISQVSNWEIETANAIKAEVSSGFDQIRKEIESIDGIKESDLTIIRDHINKSEYETATKLLWFVHNDATTALKLMRSLRIQLGFADKSKQVSLLLFSRGGLQTGKTQFVQQDVLSRKYRSESMAYRAYRGALVEAYVQAKAVALKSAGKEFVRLVDSDGNQTDMIYSLGYHDDESINLNDVIGQYFHPQSNYDFIAKE